MIAGESMLIQYRHEGRWRDYAVYCDWLSGLERLSYLRNAFPSTEWRMVDGDVKEPTLDWEESGF